MTKTFQPGDRVYNSAAHAYATVVDTFENAHGKARVLIVYTNGVGGSDTQPYSISPYWLKPLED